MKFQNNSIILKNERNVMDRNDKILYSVALLLLIGLIIILAYQKSSDFALMLVLVSIIQAFVAIVASKILSSDIKIAVDKYFVGNKKMVLFGNKHASYSEIKTCLVKIKKYL